MSPPIVLALSGIALGAAGPVFPGISPDAAALHSLLAAVPAHTDAGPGVRMASLWTAKVEQHYGASTLSAMKGTIVYDRTGRQWRTTGCSVSTLFHEAGDELCMDQLHKDTKGASPLTTNLTQGHGVHATCKGMAYPYYDLFVLLGTARKVGASIVGGVPCDLWHSETQAAGANVTATACMAADGVPRAFNMTTGLAYKAASVTAYTFSDPTVGVVAPDAFVGTDACRTRFPSPACPGNGTRDMDIYRVHSRAEPPSLANHNAGDALGDMAFFCDIIGADPSQIVTRWSVSADSAWGEYAYCLYSGGKNSCFGHTGNKVGRESSLGFGSDPACNQCSANDDFGNWYSFPDNGECQDGQSVGTGGCTWSAKPVRSVLARCIIEERGLEQVCARERGHAPMHQSAAIFAAALASADPAKGGCPDATADMVVV